MGAPATGVQLSIAVPNAQWTSVVSGTTHEDGDDRRSGRAGRERERDVQGHLGTRGLQRRPGRPCAVDQPDQRREARRHDDPEGAERRRDQDQRVPVGDGSTTNTTNAFIELYNAGVKEIDISGWTLTQHPTQQAIFSSVKIPAGTKLAAGGFYLLGLANSGLAAPAHRGDTTLSVRNTTGMNVGDAIAIDTGAGLETRRIAAVGTAAGADTTLWQPLPDGPVITIPAGSTNVPVTSVAGFAVGEKIALGYGATYPAVAKAIEQYEVATVTEVGKPGTQAFLGVEALRRSDQHQGHVGRQHHGRRQDPARHRQRRSWHRDRHGDAGRHASRAAPRSRLT